MNKLEEQIRKIIDYLEEPDFGGKGVMEMLDFNKKDYVVGEISSLIQKEREEAVRGFVDILINVLGGELADKHYGDDVVEETLNVMAVQIVNEVYKRYAEKK